VYEFEESPARRGSLALCVRTPAGDAGIDRGCWRTSWSPVPVCAPRVRASEALEHAYQGALDYHYVDEDVLLLLRVAWRR